MEEEEVVLLNGGAGQGLNPNVYLVGLESPLWGAVGCSRTERDIQGVSTTEGLGGVRVPWGVGLVYPDCSPGGSLGGVQLGLRKEHLVTITSRCLLLNYDKSYGPRSPRCPYKHYVLLNMHNINGMYTNADRIHRSVPSLSSLSTMALEALKMLIRFLGTIPIHDPHGIYIIVSCLIFEKFLYV
jgi:hypothetical protein